MSFEKYLKGLKERSLDVSEGQEDELSVVGGGGRRSRKKAEDWSVLTPEELKGRLLTELAKDERYGLIDKAKLRALSQGTNSYEEFRQIWMAAHLRPMEKDDKLDGFMSGPESKVFWNSLINGGGLSSSAGAPSINEKPQKPPPQLGSDIAAFNVGVTSAEEMWRCWKKLQTPEGRLQYLVTFLEAKSLDLLWAEEVPSEMFIGIVQDIHKVISSSDTPESSQEQLELFKDILEVASRSKRMKITKSFLSQAEKGLVEEVLDKLNSKECLSSLLR